MQKSEESGKIDSLFCGRAVIEYLFHEAMRKTGIEPERFSWSGTIFADRLYQLTVWADDRMLVEFFLEHELLFCFSIPEYYRSIERKLEAMVEELNSMKFPGSSCLSGTVPTEIKTDD